MKIPTYLALALMAAHSSQAVEHINDWSGNDWNGEPDASGEAQYVHGCGTQMFVAADGTIYQGSTSGGDHGPACLYDTNASYVRDLVSGNDNGDTYKSYLQGVTANSAYYYVAVRVKYKDFVAKQGLNANGLPRIPASSTRQWYGVARYNRSDLSPAPFPRGRGSVANFTVMIDLPSSDYDRLPYLTGLAADDNYLYVADALSNKVIRMDAKNPDLASASSVSWNFQKGTDLAVGKAGDLYALSEGVGGLLQKFSPSGQLLYTRTFTAEEEPMAIAVDKSQSSDGVLVAMDHPAARQIWRYNSALVKQTWTLGTTGGLAPGQFPDSKRFGHIKGVGVDSAGQVYVLEYGPDGIGAPDSMENITRLQKFTSGGLRLWTREAHGWIDSPGFSGLDDGVMYSTTGKYRLDYSKMDGSGRAWAWEGHTFDPVAYPHDPRAHSSMFGADVVNLGGVEFLTTFSGGQRGLAVYRWVSGVAVPTAIICPNSGGFGYAPSKPTKAWIWSDLDGAGDIDASSEYTSATWKESNMNKSYIDPNGDFWGFSDSSTTDPKVYRIPFSGLTASGIPKWNISATMIISVSSLPGAPSPIRHLGEGSYDPKTDRMYLGVFTDRSPGNSSQTEVNYQEIWCYQNWSTSPSLVWDLILSNPWPTGGGPQGLELAGDYVFVGDSASADSGTTTVDDFQVRMFRKSDGGFVETLSPPANDIHLDFDRARAIRPHLRPNGSYIVGTEAFRTQKTQLFYIPAAGGLRSLNIRKEAEAYTIDSNGESPEVWFGIRRVSSGSASGGAKVGYTSSGAWTRYDSFNFSAGAMGVTVKGSSPSQGGTVEFRLDSPGGPLLASVNIPGTGSWNSFTEVTSALSTVPTGKHNLYLRTLGNGADIDAFEFTSNATTPQTGLFSENFESGSHNFTMLSQVQIGNNGTAQGTLPAGGTLYPWSTPAVPIPIPSGTTQLTVQSDVRLPAAEVGDVMLEMILLTESSTTTLGKLFGGKINLDPAYVGEWVTYQATVTVPSTVVSIKSVRLKFTQATSSAGANTVQIDNVKVE